MGGLLLPMEKRTVESWSYLWRTDASVFADLLIPQTEIYQLLNKGLQMLRSLWNIMQNDQINIHIFGMFAVSLHFTVLKT